MEFAALLGPWSEGSGPLFRKLARAVAHAIERGALGDGARLPSERLVAEHLAIGRGTAVAAFDLLVADGLVERRRGSGTFVRVSDQPPLPPGREGSALVHRLVEHGDPHSDLIDLSISVLHRAHPLVDLATTATEVGAVVPDTGYAPRGLRSLRRAIADHVTSWGLPTSEDEVVVTTGAQQGISAAAACWIRPGDTVVVDEPTYPGALAAFVQAGARVVGAPVDQRGVRVDALEELLELGPSLVYLQSTLHSPTGRILSAVRRETIARMLEQARVPLVEDVALADLAWEPAPPPIAAHAPGAPIAVVGSLSKLFWGGLRVGFVRAPSALTLRVARIKATQDLGSSAISQVVAERLLTATDLDTLRRDQNARLRERHDVLTNALRRWLPSWSWTPPQGGLSLWVDIGRPSEPFAQHALRHGVAVATPSALAASSHHDDHLRLSFAGPPEDLEAGVERLAAAWAGSGRRR